MQVELVLTIIANDRPGLVELVAESIVKHSGNWVDSSLSRLGGSFAGIVKVTVAPENAHELEEALIGLGDKGIEISVRRGDASAGASGAKARLELLGQDHVGIVLQVTRLLAAQGVNVEDIETSVFTASMSGERMFEAKADIRLPDGKSLDELGAALESLAQDLMVEINLNDDDA